MFAFLSAIITISLLSFGAVLKQTWLGLYMLWILGVAVVVALRLFRRRSLDPPALLFIILMLFLSSLAPKLAVGMAAGAWAFLASKVDESRILRFFHFLLVLGMLEALLGLIQYFVLPGWILGYQSTPAQTSGTLINRNHFSGILEMFVPVAFGLAYTAIRRFGGFARAYLYLISGGFLGLALVFSASRMGIFSLLVTLCVLAGIIHFGESNRRLSATLGLVMTGLILAGALWVGLDAVVARYADLVGNEALINEGRFEVYRDTLRMIAALPAGVGTGSFDDRFRPYQTVRLDWEFDHAHNDYLETAAEWGLPLAAAFWSFLIFVVIRGIRLFVSTQSSTQRGLLLACVGAIFSILLHSFTDFNLQIPSNAILFFSFVGISLAMPLNTRDAQENAL